MKRYLRFEYDGYYPAGPLYDLKGQYDTLEEAQAKPCRYDNVVILDISEGLSMRGYGGCRRGEAETVKHWGSWEPIVCDS